MTDYARIVPKDLASAEQLAAQVYRRIGVQVIWTTESAKTVQPNGSFHVHVVLLSRTMTALKCQKERVPDSTVGIATKAGRRASILYSRIADHAARARFEISRPLATVLAHEIGHLLLPAYSHSQTGIMRADWDGPSPQIPGFTADQGTAIRGLLTAVHGNGSRTTASTLGGCAERDSFDSPDLS